MKYKITGIAMAVVMFICALAASTIEADEDTNRVHQHLTARQPDEGCDCDGSELCTHLPLVIIDTDGQEIPGSVTEERDAYGEALYETAADGSDVINVNVSIIDNENGNNHPSDEAQVTTLSEIRKRGHSSRRFEKAPYLLNFVDENGEGNPLSVMGMGAHSDWVLYGPYLDKSLVRNYMWYNIAGEIMEWAPNVRYCELIINGQYEGLYLMVETITNGNDCRLNLSDEVYGTSVTGYLLRGDRSTEEDVDGIRDIYTYMERTFTIGTDIEIRYPKKANLTEEMRKQIELDFAEFEKALNSYDHDTVDYGYWHYIDEDNFVDYFLINEFSINMDAGDYSTYIYKDMTGKYKMAVWDFNNACDNYVEAETGDDIMVMYSKPLFYMLTKSERFVEKIIERYYELRETFFSDEYLLNYIDETLEYLGPAIERNNERWSEAMEEWEPLKPASRNLYSHEEAVEQLKEWLVGRGHWLDENIHTIRQHSHYSRNKTYNH